MGIAVQLRILLVFDLNSVEIVATIDRSVTCKLLSVGVSICPASSWNV